MMPIFQKAVPLIEAIEKAGFEAYFVGGCVRDFILGRQMEDVDIATSATPQEIKEIFPKTIDVGIEHGTVIVIWEKNTYEITTFRTDGEYKDFRRPTEVIFIRSLIEDLKRRDFTMNSMAMDKNGNIIDPFNGQIAIENKIIETVGNASDRFHEDALRMMRAIRFVSQLSFAIETKTLHALKENVYLLKNIAIERKTVEFEKLLNGKNKKSAFKVLIDTQVLCQLPGLEKQEPTLTKMLNFRLEELSIEEIWSLILFFIGIKQSEVEDFLRKWKLSVKKMKRIKSLLFWLNYRTRASWTTETLYEAKEDILISVERMNNVLLHQEAVQNIQVLIGRYQNLTIKNREELAVGGADLLEWKGKQGGPWVKETLIQIEKAVLMEKVKNDKQCIKEWLAKCNQK